MLTSPEFKKAFDLADEPKAVRDRYGRTTYGQSCLLARRLVEAGARFVNVYLSESIGGPKGGLGRPRLRQQADGPDPQEPPAADHRPDAADADRGPGPARAC